jgi:hypothetical protein
MRDAHEQLEPTAAPARAALRIPGVDRPVSSLADFERALRPRTTVPSQRYARFLELGDEALGAAAVTTRYAAEHLRRMLEDLRGRSVRVDASLRGITPSFFSEDHAWRAIFHVLAASGPVYAEYQLLAIADYRRYLLHCLDALGQISTDRLQSTLCAESNAQGEERTELTATPRAGYDSSAQREEVLVRDLVRLPRGTTLALRHGREGPFELWLGRRRFRIETWDGASIVDEHGQGVSLRDGRNVVGRGLYNDVIVDARFTDVSRRHAILDLQDGRPAAITDLSSAGTYVARTLVNGPA